MPTQSVIIAKIQNGRKISLNEAKKQVKELGYNLKYGVDEKPNYYRFRQLDPKLFIFGTYFNRPIIKNDKPIGYLVIAAMKNPSYIFKDGKRKQYK